MSYLISYTNKNIYTETFIFLKPSLRDYKMCHSQRCADVQEIFDILDQHMISKRIILRQRVYVYVRVCVRACEGACVHVCTCVGAAKRVQTRRPRQTARTPKLLPFAVVSPARG
jgi:hypothetical protein